MARSAAAQYGQDEGEDWRPQPLPQRDRAFAYIVGRIARGGNPTLQEIADELGGVTKQRAWQVVDQLVKAGRIGRTPGAVRDLRVLDVEAARSILEDVLSQLGWSVAKPMHALQPPFTNVNLPMMPALEHLPDID